MLMNSSMPLAFVVKVDQLLEVLVTTLIFVFYRGRDFCYHLRNSRNDISDQERDRGGSQYRARNCYRIDNDRHRANNRGGDTRLAAKDEGRRMKDETAF